MQIQIHATNVSQIQILNTLLKVYLDIDIIVKVSTPCYKKVVHQAHIDNLVNSQRIFKIPSLAHSLENLP